MEALIFPEKGPLNLRLETAKLHPIICTTFVFAYVWAVGGNLIESCWDAFDTFIRNQFEDNGDAKVSPTVLAANLLLRHCINLRICIWLFQEIWTQSNYFPRYM